MAAAVAQFQPMSLRYVHGKEEDVWNKLHAFTSEFFQALKRAGISPAGEWTVQELEARNQVVMKHVNRPDLKMDFLSLLFFAGFVGGCLKVQVAHNMPMTRDEERVVLEKVNEKAQKAFVLVPYA